MLRYCFQILVLVCLTSHPVLNAAEYIRIGTNVWPGYEPLYLAREIGEFDHLPVKLVEYPSATEVLRSFRNNSIEAAALTLDEVLTLNQSNIPVTAILVMDISDGGDSIISQPGITQFNMLKNKTIAVETGALGAYMISRALEINQFTLADISIEHIDVDGHEKAFLSKQVDAVVTFEPLRTKLLKKGGHELFTSQQIPNEIIDVLVIHNDLITNDNHDTIKEILNGWFNALKFMDNNKDQAAQIMSKRLMISTQEVLDSYKGLKLPSRELNQQMMTGSPSKLQSLLKQLNKTMLEHRILAKPMPLKKIYTNKYLD